MRYTLMTLMVMFAVHAAFGRGQKLLVDSAWLESRLEKESLLVIDTGRGAEDFEQAHIPGAIYLDRAKYYDTVNEVPGMFTGVDEIVEALQEAGVTNRRQVVIYDSGNALWASRLFWTLEFLGHNRVAILDGGLAKWVDDGLEVETGASSRTIARGAFKPKIHEELVATGDWLVDNLDKVKVVDARSVGEYVGADVRAERGGHIPDARNIDWVLALTDEEPSTFLPVEELAELYEANEVARKDLVVTHCQTGVRGAHTYFVLRLLGYKNVALYDASWVEWGNDERFPIVLGEEG